MGGGEDMDIAVDQGITRVMRLTPASVKEDYIMCTTHTITDFGENVRSIHEELGEDRFMVVPKLAGKVQRTSKGYGYIKKKTSTGRIESA